MEQAALSETLRETLAVFEESEAPWTTPEVAERLDLGRRTAYARLDRLVDHGVLETKKVGANARVWWQPASTTSGRDGSASDSDDSPSSSDNSPSSSDNSPSSSDGSPPSSDNPPSSSDRPREERQTDSEPREWSVALESIVSEVLDEVDIAIFALDADGFIQTWNPGAERIKGYAPDEILGEHVSVFYPDEDVAADVPADNLSQAAEHGTVTDEGWRVRADDSRFWADVTIVAIRDGDGILEGYTKVTRDMTEKREYERTLEVQAERLERHRDELESELDRVFERISDGFYALDEDLRFLYLNEHAADVLGLDESALGRNFLDVVTTTDEFERALYEARDTQEPVIFEDYYDPVDGWFSNAIYPSDSGLSVYFRDITERKRRQQELERYVGVVDAIGEPVYEADADSCLVFVNDAFVEYSGYEESELLGHHVSIGMDAETIAEAESLIRDLLRTDDDEVAALEYEVQTKEGERIPVENRFSLLTDDEGQLRGSAGMLWDVTERKEREQALEHRNAQLETLNSLNEVVNEITDAVIDTSTREGIEQAVCDALAAADAYEFAWFAEVSPNTDVFEPRATARTRGYAEEITVSLDPEDPRSEGPGATAIREQETQVVRDVFTDPTFEPWREAASEYGFTAVASIPVVYEGLVYGVLGVYADRENAFETAEREVVSQLGEVVGHAIAAVERKRALMSDEVVELEFQIQDIFEVVGAPVATDETITLDYVVPVDDDEYLLYGTAAADAVDALRGLCGTVPYWDSVVIRSEGEPVQFEARLTEPPVLSVVAALGGYVDNFVIEDGDCSTTLHLAPGADVRRAIDAVEKAYPQAKLVRRQQRVRSSDSPQRIQQFVGGLTERQRAALDAAYHAGYFEWPRRTDGTAVADSLGIAPPTFNQHLRKAQQKVLDSLYSTTT